MTRPGDDAIEANGLEQSFGDTRAADGVDRTVRLDVVAGLFGPPDLYATKS